MRTVTIGFAALATMVAAGLGVLQAADAPAVTIAVLRGDGILIPIATRAGTKWSHTWPMPDKSADVPLGLDGIPKRWWGKAGPTARWHAWQIDGSTADAVVERPTWYLAHCQQGIGLKTSLTAEPPVPPPTVQPYPKLGLAATAPLAFQRIEPLDQSAPIWMHVADAMTTAMAKAEDEMAALTTRNLGYGAPPKHPIAAAERAKVPVRVEALYRMPLARDRYLYYAETTKRYGMPPMPAGSRSPTPSPRRDGCSIMSFAAGWFVAGSDGKLPTVPTIDGVQVTSCEYDGVWLMLPLGYIADGADRLWIAQLNAWGTESYVVLRWDADKAMPVVVSQTPGGWCETPRS